MRLLTIACIILFASAAYAGNVTTLGMFGTVASYTTVFSSIWDGSDVIDTGGSGTGVPWTSETDTGSQGTLSSATYQVALSSSSTLAYLTKTGLTARSDWRYSFSFTPSTIATNTNNTRIQLGTMGNGTQGNAITIGTYSSGNNIAGIRVEYWNAVPASVGAEYAYTFTAGQSYTIELRFKHSSDGSTSDGSYDVLINGASIGSVANLISRYTSADRFTLGVTYIQNGVLSATYTFDNFVWGWK